MPPLAAAGASAHVAGTMNQGLPGLDQAAPVHGLLGVLGGMGPLATVDFFQKIVEETAAESDQAHLPLIINSTPDIPCRTSAILAGGASPLPAMLAGMARLRRSGVECVAIPCNTAHHWFDELCACSGLPVLHIADAVGHELARLPAGQGRTGLLATEGTLSAGIYRKRLQGRELAVNTQAERERWVQPAIALVKQGHPRQAAVLVEQAIKALLDAGVDHVILGCTELSVALASIDSVQALHCVDSSRALARACVRWYGGRLASVAV